MFQRPERASLISTDEVAELQEQMTVFQRPERASLISTH